MAVGASVVRGMTMNAAVSKAMEAIATKPPAANATESISVAIRIVAIGIVTVRIVAVIWIGRVEERVAKIVKEEDPIVEAVMVEPIAAKGTSAKAAPTKATAMKAPTAVKAATAVKSTTDVSAPSTEPAVATATAATVCHHV
jgi:hypothetical protein